MTTLLVPIDFSPVSRRVMDQAMDLARTTNGRVVLLHAVQPPAIISDLAPMAGETLRFTNDLERSARRHLQRWQKKYAESGITVDVICEQGFPVPCILTHAERLDARYIVLGSHGHTALYDLVVGSTASGILKRARCSVIIVPAGTRKRVSKSPNHAEMAAK